MATVRANAQLDATWRGGNATKTASRDITGLERDSQKASTGFGGLSKAVGLAAVGFTAAASAGAVLARGISTVTKLAAEQQRVEQQLAATLESTGHAAGMSAEELKKLAADLQTMTTYGDEAIIASESLLLTFTKIGRDTFPAAQTAILDMATAMGQDLQSATIMVGKALNDPIAGITAMSRAGIQFTEDQKATIKTMVDMGDTAGAQAMILKELETQFGGSAAAAATTFGGRMTQLQNIIGDVGEEIGFQLLPAMTKLAEEAGPAILEAVQELAPEINSLGDSAVAAADAMVPLIRNLSTFIRVGQTSGRVARAITTLGLSELYRWLRDTERTQSDLNDTMQDYPPYATNAARAAAAEAAEIEALNRQLEFNSQRGRTATTQTVELGSAIDDTSDVIKSVLPPMLGYRNSMTRMGEAHDQTEPAIRETAAAVRDLSAAVGATFVSTLDSGTESTTALSTAAQDLNQFILDQAAAAGATTAELALLSTGMGTFTQAQIDAAIKAAEFETQLEAARQQFINGQIDIDQYRIKLENLFNIYSSFEDRTVTLTLRTIQEGNMGFGAPQGNGTGQTVAAGTGTAGAAPPPLSGGGGGQALGGPVRRGVATLVGEMGPEVFVPPVSGQIVNNRELGAMMGGQSIGNINIYITQPNASPAQIATAVAEGIGRRSRG